MITENFDYIQFIDSYITGWDISEDKIIIDLYLILLEEHELFTPFNDETEFACYKNACILIEGYGEITGFSKVKQEKKWNEELQEFNDFGEIDDFNMDEHDNELCIVTDEGSLNIKDVKKISIMFI